MRRTEIPWTELLPIENPRELGYGRIPEIISKRRRLSSLPCVSIIPFVNDFIVWDGHGCTIAYMLEGKILIPCAVLETDTDLKKATANVPRQIRTIAGVQEEYTTQIRPELQTYGIANFSDYPLFRELVRRGTAR